MGKGCGVWWWGVRVRWRSVAGEGLWLGVRCVVWGGG